MIKSTKTVAEALSKARCWDVTRQDPWVPLEHAIFRAQIYISSNIFRYENFSYSELAEHHLCLPEIIDNNRQAHIDREEGSTALGYDINFSLDLLKGNYLKFVDDRGVPQTISGITMLDYNPLYPSCLMIDGYALQTSHFTRHSLGIPYVSSSQRGAYYAPVDQLNDMYPGWQQRWGQCKALDIAHEDMLNHVFKKDDALIVIPTLPELNFD